MEADLAVNSAHVWIPRVACIPRVIATTVHSLAAFYRVTDDGRKVSGLRGLAYTCLGAALSGLAHPVLVIANVVAVTSLLLFFGAYGNYWDWRLLRQSNATGRLIESAGWSLRTGLLLCVAPLAVCTAALSLAVFRHISLVPVVLLTAVFALGVAYIGPAVRVKTTRLGWLVTPAVAMLLFIEAWAVSGRPFTGFALTMCVLLGLFQLHLELLHLLDDATHEQDAPAWCAPARLRRWLPRVSRISAAVAAAAAWAHPLLLNSMAWSLFRARAASRLQLETLNADRRAIWRPLVGAQEFAVYAVIAVWTAGWGR